jgi:hypothetical protein
VRPRLLSAGETEWLAVGRQLEVFRELLWDSRPIPHTPLNRLLVVAQNADTPGSIRQMAANHVDEYLNLPRPEGTPIQISGKQFLDQPIELRQDRIAVCFKHLVRFTYHGVSVGSLSFR